MNGKCDEEMEGKCRFDGAPKQQQKAAMAIKSVMISNASERAPSRAPNNINNRIEMTTAQIGQ